MALLSVNVYADVIKQPKPQVYTVGGVRYVKVDDYNKLVDTYNECRTHLEGTTKALDECSSTLKVVDKHLDSREGYFCFRPFILGSYTSSGVDAGIGVRVFSLDRVGLPLGLGFGGSRYGLFVS